MGLQAEICGLDVHRDAHLPGVVDNAFGRPAGESGIDVDGDKAVIHRDALLAFSQQPQQGPTILTAGQTDGDAVPVIDHMVCMQGFAQRTIERFI